MALDAVRAAFDRLRGGALDSVGFLLVAVAAFLWAAAPASAGAEADAAVAGVAALGIAAAAAGALLRGRRRFGAIAGGLGVAAAIVAAFWARALPESASGPDGVGLALFGGGLAVASVGATLASRGSGRGPALARSGMLLAALGPAAWLPLDLGNFLGAVADVLAFSGAVLVAVHLDRRGTATR